MLPPFSLKTLQVFFQSLIMKWATTLMNQLTYEPIKDEPFMQSYLRYQLAPFMCNLNQAECRQAARQQFQDLRVNGIEYVSHTK